jgi:hypothetical protein
MFVHYESVCVDSSYSTTSPVKVDLIGGDVDIYQTQPEMKCRISHSLRGRLRKLTVMEVLVTVSCGVSIKHAQLAT